MDIKNLQAVVIDALEDIKGQDIKLFDTTHLTSLFDRIVIVSGTSNRQTKALAASVRDKVKEAGGNVIGMEGGDTGEWVLVDLGDMLVHIMQAPIRAYYRLEEIWGDKEINLGAAKRTAKKTGATAAEPKKVSRHLASMQVAEEVAPIKEKAPRKKAAASAEVPAKKPRAPRKAVASTAVEGEEAAVKKPRAPRKAAEAKVAVGKTVKVAQTKTVEAELKEIKEAKTRARKAATEAPAPRVLKRVTKKAPDA